MANQNLLQWDWKAWNMLANISFLLTCLLTHAKMFRHLEVKYWRSWFPHVMIHIEPQRSCSENLLMKWNRVREVLEKGFACNEWTVKNLKFLTLVWNLECPMWIYVLNLSASWHTCWELKHLSMCTLLWVCLWLFVRFSTYMGLELRMHAQVHVHCWHECVFGILLSDSWHTRFGTQMSMVHFCTSFGNRKKKYSAAERVLSLDCQSKIWQCLWMFISLWMRSLLSTYKNCSLTY